MHASVQTLLASVVDYAGLFPPARLDLPQAISHYANYRSSIHHWMLGRFVLPLARLQEFEDLLAVGQGELSIPVSAIVTKDWELDLERIESSELRGQGDIAALEFPALLQPADIATMLPHLPKGVDAFFEIPSFERTNDYVAVLQGSGAAAKVRLGGLTGEAFLSPEEVARTVLAFTAARLPFKATAGLHHPLPAPHALPDGGLASMQGFLNLAIATALAYWYELTETEVQALLQEPSIDRFQFSDEGLSWGDRHLTLSQINEARQRSFRSFGSCSFEEPVDDLEALELL